MVNEIPFKKKKENVSVLAWCNNIKLWPGKFPYYFIVYFSFSLLQSKQYIWVGFRKTEHAKTSKIA